MAQDIEADIVRAARGWIGTPYRHQCSTKGQGADCLGLLRGVWREVLGAEPEQVPSYTSDWSEPSGEERLWQAAERHLQSAVINPTCKGNVVLFRMRSRSVAKHLAILGDGSRGFATIIHAYSGTGVVETPLTQAWARRIAAQFEFPNRRG
jgi:NlpC/P60 family putative phage cell wall peptidase